MPQKTLLRAKMKDARAEKKREETLKSKSILLIIFLMISSSIYSQNAILERQLFIFQDYYGEFQIKNLLKKNQFKKIYSYTTNFSLYIVHGKPEYNKFLNVEFKAFTNANDSFLTPFSTNWIFRFIKPYTHFNSNQIVEYNNSNRIFRTIDVKSSITNNIIYYDLLEKIVKSLDPSCSIYSYNSKGQLFLIETMDGEFSRKINYFKKWTYNSNENVVEYNAFGVSSNKLEGLKKSGSTWFYQYNDNHQITKRIECLNGKNTNQIQECLYDKQYRKIKFLEYSSNSYTPIKTINYFYVNNLLRKVESKNGNIIEWIKYYEYQ